MSSNPIAAFNEIHARNGLPLPVFTLTNIGKEYQASVDLTEIFKMLGNKIDGSIISSIQSSKSVAKTHVAKKAMIIILGKDENSVLRGASLYRSFFENEDSDASNDSNDSKKESYSNYNVPVTFQRKELTDNEYLLGKITKPKILDQKPPAQIFNEAFPNAQIKAHKRFTTRGTSIAMSVNGIMGPWSPCYLNKQSAKNMACELFMSNFDSKSIESISKTCPTLDIVDQTNQIVKEEIKSPSIPCIFWTENIIMSKAKEQSECLLEELIKVCRLLEMNNIQVLTPPEYFVKEIPYFLPSTVFKLYIPEIGTDAHENDFYTIFDNFYKKILKTFDYSIKNEGYDLIPSYKRHSVFLVIEYPSNIVFEIIPILKIEGITYGFPYNINKQTTQSLNLKLCNDKRINYIVQNVEKDKLLYLALKKTFKKFIDFSAITKYDIQLLITTLQFAVSGCLPRAGLIELSDVYDYLQIAVLSLFEKENIPENWINDENSEVYFNKVINTIFQIDANGVVRFAAASFDDLVIPQVKWTSERFMDFMFVSIDEIFDDMFSRIDSSIEKKYGYKCIPTELKSKVLLPFPDFNIYFFKHEIAESEGRKKVEFTSTSDIIKPSISELIKDYCNIKEKNLEILRNYCVSRLIIIVFLLHLKRKKRDKGLLGLHRVLFSQNKLDGEIKINLKENRDLDTYSEFSGSKLDYSNGSILSAVSVVFNVHEQPLHIVSFEPPTDDKIKV